MKNLLLAALCLFSTSAALHALSIRVLAWDDEIAERKLALVDGKGVTELKDLHPLGRSPSFNLNPSQEAPAQLRALDRLDDKGAPAADPIRFPQGIKRPLLLLLPDPKAATGVRPMVIEDDTAGFRWGMIRVVNTTGKQLLFKCENKVAPLPATWTPVDIDLGGQTRNVEVLMALREKPTEPLYSSVWEYHDGMRQLVFIVPSGNAADGPVTFKFIMEHRIDAEAAQPTE
jgi:hypothetical protein